MSGTLAEFNQLTDAEQYFEFFNLPYDPTIVNVNRLHILRKFSSYMEEINTQSTEASETEILDQYSQALQQAYNVFLSSTPVQEKLFKVFNDKAKGVVLLNEVGVDD